MLSAILLLVLPACSLKLSQELLVREVLGYQGHLKFQAPPPRFLLMGLFCARNIRQVLSEYASIHEFKSSEFILVGVGKKWSISV